MKHGNIGLGLCAVALLLTACLSTNLAPIGAPGTGSLVSPENDERELWEATRQAEAQVLSNKSRYEDGAMETYLQQIADRLTPTSYKHAGGNPILVKVRKDPRLNAFAMAHGTIGLHTSIAARAENEAQIAGILAHEITHVTHRHQVRKARELQNQRTAINVAGFLGTLALAAAAVDQSRRGNPDAGNALVQGGTPLLLTGLQLTHAAIVNGYSRDLEREADEEGMRLMAAAGYAPRELKSFFQRMLAESPDAGPIETFFYGSHPRTRERIETVERFSESARVGGQSPISSGGDFERRLVRVRVANAQYDAHMGRLVLAGKQANKAVDAGSPALRPVLSSFVNGHLYVAAANGARQRNEPAEASRWVREADQAYRAAIAKGHSIPGAAPTTAAAYKSVGLLYHDAPELEDRRCEGKAHLEKYIELAPAAADRPQIEAKLGGFRCGP